MNLVEQTKQAAENQEVTKREVPRSLEHFEKGVRTAAQLAAGMSMLMADLITERVGTSVGNAVCNAGGKMLKAAEMQHRFGRSDSQGNKDLLLT